MKIAQLVHSIDLSTGGVAKAVLDLGKAFKEAGIESEAIVDTRKMVNYDMSLVIAHGLWQWPGFFAYKLKKEKGIPYIIFPHGMLDPWFKKTYRLKHLKKQIYWWLRQRKVLSKAKAVCFTTEEERRLAQTTFWPYHVNELVTGLGVSDPLVPESASNDLFTEKFPEVLGKKILLYMGRIHPKKGLDILLKAFAKYMEKNHLLVIAGPIDRSEGYVQMLRNISQHLGNKVLWTDMLEGDLKWGALRAADGLILPSHQENYGMVVAEACSVGAPVFITNKVSLYQEILQYDAGFVEKDTVEGIEKLIGTWASGEHSNKRQNARKCFEEKLQISRCAEKIIRLLKNKVISQM